MRIKLTIEYDGSGFCGWQRQKNDIGNHKRSVQEVVELGIGKLFGVCDDDLRLFCAGRTDSGVHAVNQVAHFDIMDYSLQNKWSEKIYNLPKAINYHLDNKNVVVKSAELVDRNFHARFSAVMRYYKYIIYQSRSDSVFWSGRAWHIRRAIDFDGMRRAANNLVGNHDFTSFCSSQCQYDNKVRTINSVQISDPEDNIIEIDVIAKSFLHNQVRIIVGTLVDIGLGRLHYSRINKIIEAKSRSAAGATAPAHGLYFMKVDY